VRSDPEKIKAVLDWPVPETRKQLQRFLGFANFYRQFIRGTPVLFSPAKISFILRLLTGRALKWAEARFPDCQQFGCTFNEFLAEFKMVFAAEADQVQDSSLLVHLLRDFA
uniref:DUF4939 domain-containing protein n=1 Tax=Fundulus heteroclitus TaxID=8078 RepID=A0A3Q2PR12_FUNHE